MAAMLSPAFPPALTDRIRRKLESYVSKQQVPNLLFHGPDTTLMYQLVQWMIHLIYQACPEEKAQFVLVIHCGILAHSSATVLGDPNQAMPSTTISGAALNNGGYNDATHGWTIASTPDTSAHTIQQRIARFVKTRTPFINPANCARVPFKTVVLLQGEQMTMDMQFALRRTIEVHSSDARFFMVAHHSANIMRPIQSRFCPVYVSSDRVADVGLGDSTAPAAPWDTLVLQGRRAHTSAIVQMLHGLRPETMTLADLHELVAKFIDRGLDVLDLARAVDHSQMLLGAILSPEDKKHKLHFLHVARGAIRCEETCLLIVLMHFLRSTHHRPSPVDLEWATFM